MAMIVCSRCFADYGDHNTRHEGPMRDWLRWTACCVMLCSFACDDDGDEDHDHPSMDAGKSDAGKADAGKTSDAGKADAGAPAYSSETYSKDENWLCKPGASNSRCKDPVEATEI